MSLRWETVDLDPWMRDVPHHLRIRVVDLQGAAIGHLINSAEFKLSEIQVSHHVANAILLWNKAAQDDLNAQTASGNTRYLDAYGRAFGGITRVQFIEEFLKPAWDMDLREAAGASAP